MDKYVTDTLQFLAKQLYQAQHPVLWTSGGKDSTVVLHLCRPWARQLTLLHMSLEDAWPGVTDTLLDNCRAWGYSLSQIRFVKPPCTFWEYVSRFGWPMDIVPSRWEGGTALTETFRSPETPRVVSWLHFNVVRWILPLLQTTIEQESSLVLTGSRLEDGEPNASYLPVVPVPSPVPMIRLNPLSAWTSAEVWAYIDREQIPLPPTYVWKRRFAQEHGPCISDSRWDLHDPRLWHHVMPQFYPDLYAAYWPIARTIYRAMRDHLRPILTALEALPLEEAAHG